MTKHPVFGFNAPASLVEYVRQYFAAIGADVDFTPEDMAEDLAERWLPGFLAGHDRQRDCRLIVAAAKYDTTVAQQRQRENGLSAAIEALHTHDPCCSSHGVPMTCAKYRRTHFVEVRPCCAIDAAILAANRASPANQADYGVAAGPDAPDPSETTCRRCGRLAVDHLPGRFSIHGTCPADSADTDRDARPLITVLCGSTRFYRQFQEANYQLTMQGRIVLSVGFYPHSTEQAHGESVGITSDEKAALDELHKRKIDLADDVLVLDVGGYIGDSTRSEIEYATAAGKPIRYLSAEFAVACTCGWSGTDWPDAKDHIVDKTGEHTVTRATNADANEGEAR